MPTRFALIVATVFVILPYSAPAQPVAVGGDFQINTYTTEGQNSSTVAMTATGEFVVSWVSEENVTEGQEGQDGDLAGVFAQRFDSDGSPVGGEFQVNVTTAGAQYAPSIATDDNGNFTILWESPDGSGDGVFGRTFLADGTPLTGEYQVSTHTTSDQDEPVIAELDGGFVAVWTNLDTANIDVRVGQVDIAGTAVNFGPMQSIGSTPREIHPDVDAADDGSFVVVFQDDDDDDLGVSGQRFDSAGLPAGAIFRVNTYTTGNQLTPAVSVAGNGDFVVVWEDRQQKLVLMRRYQVDGTPKGDEQIAGVANATTPLTTSPRWPDVMLNNTGTIFVIWETFNDNVPGGDFSGAGVAGRLFGPNGVPVGPKFRVNDDLVSSQRNPALAGDRSGSYVVTWDQSSDQDGDEDSTEGRRFGPPLATSTTTTTSVTTTSVTSTTTTTTTLPPGSCGDLDGNGIVTSTDAFGTLVSALGLGVCQLCLCDANGDGVLTSTDALLLLHRAVSLPVTLMCPAC